MAAFVWLFQFPSVIKATLGASQHTIPDDILMFFQRSNNPDRKERHIRLIQDQKYSNN